MRKKAAGMSANELAAYIDQIILDPGFTQNEIIKNIQEGINFRCRTVRVSLASLAIARKLCADTLTGISVAYDYRLGSDLPRAFLIGAEEIVSDGDVTDIEIAANLEIIKSGMFDGLENSIRALADLCHKNGTLLKVILETDSLNLDQIAGATESFCRAGADFITSFSVEFLADLNKVGFLADQNKKESTSEALTTIIDAAKGRCRIKSFGCIRAREQLLRLIDMGIDRVGIDCAAIPAILGAS